MTRGQTKARHKDVWDIQRQSPGLCPCTCQQVSSCLLAASLHENELPLLPDYLLIAISYFAAYKEKMKELSLLSLICSCFHTQPHPNTIYQYGGTAPVPQHPLSDARAGHVEFVPSRSSSPCSSPGSLCLVSFHSSFY